MASGNSTTTPSAFFTVYAVVKYLAMYAGCFLGCYYWPLFIFALVGQHGDPRSFLVAGVLITPLGFLILGAALGKYTAVAHLVLLLIGAGAAVLGVSQLLGAEEALPRLVAVWTPVIVLVYLAGFVVGLRRALKAV